MKLTFKSLLGVVPRGDRSVGEIVAAGVSVKIEERTNLSTSDKLKLAKAAREGGGDKFTIFESDKFYRTFFVTCIPAICQQYVPR